MKIHEDEFYRFLCNFYSYFGRDKFPKKERALFLYRKIDHLNKKDVEEAFKRMEDDNDRMPQNIPKAIKQTTYDLKSADPDYAKKKDFSPGKLGACEDCNGYGIFKVRHFEHNTRYELIKYCGSCKNWKQWVNDPGERMTAAQLQSRNIEFVPYNKQFPLASYKGLLENQGNSDFNKLVRKD